MYVCTLAGLVAAAGNAVKGCDLLDLFSATAVTRWRWAMRWIVELVVRWPYHS